MNRNTLLARLGTPQTKKVPEFKIPAQEIELNATTRRLFKKYRNDPCMFDLYWVATWFATWASSYNNPNLRADVAKCIRADAKMIAGWSQKIQDDSFNRVMIGLAKLLEAEEKHAHARSVKRDQKPRQKRTRR